MLEHAGVVRLALFMLVLIGLSLWELKRPWQRLQAKQQWYRRGHHLGLLVVGTLFIRMLLPIGTLGWAHWCQQQGWGWFHAVDADHLISYIGLFLALDVIIYWQHRLSHHWPWLWRLHRVHHSDPHLDVTTALRFHPLELLVSTGIKCVAIALLGVPVWIFFAFECYLSCSALFTHANFSWSNRTEYLWRKIWITPALHRVHHSIRRSEQRKNFSFGLNCWDRCFGSYQPEAGTPLQLGSEPRHNPPRDSLPSLLISPLYQDKDNHPTSRQ